MSKFLTLSSISKCTRAVAVAALLVSGLSIGLNTITADQAYAQSSGGGGSGGGGNGGGSNGGGDGGDRFGDPKLECLGGTCISAINLPPTTQPKPKPKVIKVRRDCASDHILTERVDCVKYGSF